MQPYIHLTNILSELHGRLCLLEQGDSSGPPAQMDMKHARNLYIHTRMGGMLRAIHLGKDITDLGLDPEDNLGEGDDGVVVPVPKRSMVAKIFGYGQLLDDTIKQRGQDQARRELTAMEILKDEKGFFRVVSREVDSVTLDYYGIPSEYPAILMEAEPDLVSIEMYIGGASDMVQAVKHCLDITDQMLCVLVCLHKAGITHRDFMENNTKINGEGVFFLYDFSRCHFHNDGSFPFPQYNCFPQATERNPDDIWKDVEGMIKVYELLCRHMPRTGNGEDRSTFFYIAEYVKGLLQNRETPYSPQKILDAFRECTGKIPADAKSVAEMWSCINPNPEVEEDEDDWWQRKG